MVGRVGVALAALAALATPNPAPSAPQRWAEPSSKGAPKPAGVNAAGDAVSRSISPDVEQILEQYSDVLLAKVTQKMLTQSATGVLGATPAATAAAAAAAAAAAPL